MPDILIPNIEIPKEGYAVQIILFDDCRVQFSGRTVKAVKLPPHGDLISREQAFQMMLNRGYQKEAAGVILEVPTVIPASEKEDANG